MTKTMLSLVHTFILCVAVPGGLSMLRLRDLSHLIIVPRIRRRAGSRFLCPIKLIYLLLS
jgi:hypothetical protein